MDNKPNETNGNVENLETLNEVLAGSGQEDVGGEDASAPSLEELNRITGRNFNSLEDFEKHYKNLNSLVGDQTRVENEKKAKELESLKSQTNSPELQERLDRLEAIIAEKDFIRENPTAEKALDLVKAVAKAKGVSLEEAWTNEVKDVAESAYAYKEEKEIGVRSKNRIIPAQAKKVQELANQIRQTGSDEAKEALVGEWLGLN